MKKLLYLLCYFIASCPISSFAQTLTPGDIAVIGFNYDNPDQLKLVALRDVPSGTTFSITDNGWSGSALSSGEGIYSYVASGPIAAGTVWTVNTTGMSLMTSGDQVIIYQGTVTAPTCIFALSTTPWVTGTIGSTTSRLPPGLTNGVNAMAFSIKRDNGKYTIAANSGIATTMLASITNQANWSITNTRISSWPAWTFTFDTYAPEPLANPATISFSNVLSYKLIVSYPAVAADGYVLLRKSDLSIVSAPVDGQTYTRGDYLGDAQVAYIGNLTSFTQTGIVAGSAYHYAVYAYNGTGNQINYTQTSPAVNAVSTLPNGMGSYYDSVNPLDTAFITQLKNRIRSPYTKVSYDQYDETIITEFAYKDAPGDMRTVTCAYSGEQYSYSPPFVWYTASPFSREHTWCHSWMPTYSSTSGNEYADQHHLFPVNQTKANGPRSNHPLGKVVTVTQSYLEGKLGLDSLGATVYEPRNAQKGDAARALIYMSLRYDKVNGYDWTFDRLNTVILPALTEAPQSLPLLLQWNAQDPPDNFEIARNDYIQSRQQNRNPFIDHPGYLSYINLNNLTYINATARMASVTSTSYKTNMETLVYPIPSNGEVNIENSVVINEPVILKLYNMQGILVSEQRLNSSSVVHTNFDVPAGLYTLMVAQGSFVSSTRWIKQ